MFTRVEVRGLADLRRELRKVDRALPRELNKALREKAAKPVADRGRRYAKGRVAKGIKPFASGNRIGVRGYHPGSGVHEFMRGGQTFTRTRRGRREKVRWNDPRPVPRNIWRAAEELEPQIVEDVWLVVRDTASAQGWLR